MNKESYHELEENLLQNQADNILSSNKKMKRRTFEDLANGEYKLTLEILGGCWNSQFLNNGDLEASVEIVTEIMGLTETQELNPPQKMKLLDTEERNRKEEEKAKTPDCWEKVEPEYHALQAQKEYNLTNTKVINGLIVNTVPFKFSGKHRDVFNKMDDMHIKIRSKNDLEGNCLTIMVPKECIESIRYDLLENPEKATKVWKSIPLQSKEEHKQLRYPPHIRSRYFEIPLLTQKYVQLETPGWLDFRLTLSLEDIDVDVDDVVVYPKKEEHANLLKPLLDRAEPIQEPMNTIQYVALAFQNMLLSGKDKRSDAALVFYFIEANIFVEAFELWLSIGWNDTFHFAIDVLVLIKNRVINNEPEWLEVQSECESSVKKLLNKAPTVSEKGDPFYTEIAYAVDKKLSVILDYELKTITEHESVHTIIQGFWGMKTLTLTPIPAAITRSQYWTIRSFFFLLYVALLVNHVYEISQTNDFLLREMIEDTINIEEFEELETFDDFWNWLNNTFIAGMYDRSEPHVMMLIDDVLLRQTRVEPEICSNFVVPNLPFICYPRPDTDSKTTSYSVWKNTTLLNLGKETFKSSFSNTHYKDTFIASLTTNKTIAIEKVTQLISDQWVDWATQVVAVEYLVYSPNSRLMAAGIASLEISAVGYFQCSIDLIVLPEAYLDKGYSWSAIILCLFLTGFILEEIIDFGMSSPWGGTTSEVERRESEHLSYFSYCYLYFSSIWNVIDVLLISCGFTYLILQHDTTVDSYNLREVWEAIRRRQTADVFGALAIILSFVRVLDFFTSWKFVGVLIITILKMFIDIGRFLLIFIVIVLGFTSAFHLSYSGTTVDDFSDFVKGTIYVFTTTPSGYSTPEIEDILGEPGIFFAKFFQIIYVFLGIILLLNLLIALMSDTYQNMNEQAETEFRWHAASALMGKSREFALWPSPFSIFHFLLAIPTACFYCYSQFSLNVEKVDEGKPILERKLYGKMVWSYLKSLNKGANMIYVLPDEHFDNDFIKGKKKKGKIQQKQEEERKDFIQE